MPSVPEPTYTLPEDASSEDIYELINTLPLPSRCNAIIIKLPKITRKCDTSRCNAIIINFSKIKCKFVTSPGSLWQLGAQPRDQGENQKRTGVEGEEGGNETLLLRKQHCKMEALPCLSSPKTVLQLNHMTASQMNLPANKAPIHQFLLGGNPAPLPPHHHPGVDY